MLSRQVEASSGKPVCCNGRSRIDSPSPSSQRTGRYRDGNFHGCQVHSTTERELAANAHLSSYSGCVHPGHHPASPHAYLCVVPPGCPHDSHSPAYRDAGMRGCSRIAPGGGCCLPRCVAALQPPFCSCIEDGFVHRGREEQADI